MKIVFFARHAKSNWGEAGISDFERPINTQGELDAPAMAAYLNTKKFIPQQIISSDAVRALQTAAVYKTQLTPKQNIIKNASLYNAGPLEIEQTVIHQKDNISSIMIVGHNPGMTEIVNLYALNSGVSDMPSCGVAIVQFKAERWKDIKHAGGELIAFEFPK